MCLCKKKKNICIVDSGTISSFHDITLTIYPVLFYATVKNPKYTIEIYILQQKETGKVFPKIIKR